MGGTNSNDVIASLVFYRDEPPRRRDATHLSFQLHFGTIVTGTGSNLTKRYCFILLIFRWSEVVDCRKRKK
jgi:hypothetical protein